MAADESVDRALRALLAHFATESAERVRLPSPEGGVWHLNTPQGDVRTPDADEGLLAILISEVNRWTIGCVVRGDSDAVPPDTDAAASRFFEAADGSVCPSSNDAITAAARELLARLGSDTAKPSAAELAELLRLHRHP